MFTLGQEQLRPHVLGGQTEGEELERCTGHDPTSKWPIGEVTVLLSTQGGVQGAWGIPPL